MACPLLRLPQNVEGDLYVDSTCIDCDTCRQLAPATFSRADVIESSCLARQPTSDEVMERALVGLVACPTASIGSNTSMERMLAHRFTRVLPGHGPVFTAADAGTAHESVRALLKRMGGRTPTRN